MSDVTLENGQAKYQVWLDWFNQSCARHFENQFTERTPSERLLWESMSYSMQLPSKRFRPILFLATLDFLGLPARDFFAGALSLECVHTFSLIHDDLPAMDNDDFRRGKPSNHKVYGEAIAILAGDSLFNYAYQLLVESLPVNDSSKLKILAVLMQHSGHLGIMGGQSLDILSEKKQPLSTPLSSAEALKKLKTIHEQKTVALILACVQMAAACAQTSENSRALLTQYAYHMGLCFQIVDDILDETADFQKLGKTIGKDKDLGKLTYVTLLGLDGAQSIAQEEYQKANQALQLLLKNEKQLGKDPRNESFLFLKYLVDMVYERKH